MALHFGVDAGFALLQPLHQRVTAAAGHHLQTHAFCGSLHHGAHRAAPAAQTLGRWVAGFLGCREGLVEGCFQPDGIDAVSRTKALPLEAAVACADQQLPTFFAVFIQQRTGVKVELPSVGKQAHPAFCSCVRSMLRARLARSLASAITASLLIKSSPGWFSSKAVLRPMRPRPGSSSVIRA